MNPTQRLKIALREPKRWFVRKVLVGVSRYRFSSILFYLGRAKVFGREQHAVASGVSEYRQAIGDGRPRFLLRRNIHMLEKGLSMRPRRELFALDYIEETVRVQRQLVNQLPEGSTLDTELQWANDVINAYFGAVGSAPAVERARAQFSASPVGRDERVGRSPAGLAPYPRDVRGPSPVEFEQLHRLAQQRRSVRWFLDKPVERELVEQAADVASLSPSACNRQPFEFRVFDQPEKVLEVAEVPMGTAGWVENIPVFVLIVGDLSAFFSERDRHAIYTDGCLAAMSFVLALETLGLSSCCVNWPDIPEREQRMASILGLEKHQRPVMGIALGYPDPDGFVPYSQKSSPHQLLRWGS